MKKVYIGIVVLVAVFIYLFISQKIGGNRDKQFFIRFDTTDINGELEYVNIKYRMCVLKIEGIENEFYFDPITSTLNENKIFEYTAEKGDFVIKKAHSDILILKKKDNKVYKYKFRKPHD